jgi:SAM-dependent methyltransferase
MSWDAYWRFELFRRACDPLDFRKWKRDSQRELKKLYPGEPLLLDSTAGLGDHTVNLAEEGFRVEACDDSEVALDATQRAVGDAGLDVRVFRARWEELGTITPAHYDLVFNDALHWTYDEGELRAALRGLFGALRPGGALVFFFADEREPEPGAGLSILEWDWRKMEPERVVWDHASDGHRVTLTITPERGPDFIDEHHVFLSREEDAHDSPRSSAGHPGGVRAEDAEGPRIRTRETTADLRRLTMRRVYRWDWHGLVPLLRDAGFTGERSDHFENVKGYTFAMSRAFRPA